MIQLSRTQIIHSKHLITSSNSYRNNCMYILIEMSSSF